MLLFGNSQKIACSDNDSFNCVRIGHKNRRGHKLALVKVMRKTLTPEFRMSTSHFMFSEPDPLRGVTRTF